HAGSATARGARVQRRRPRDRKYPSTVLRQQLDECLSVWGKRAPLVPNGHHRHPNGLFPIGDTDDPQLVALHRDIALDNRYTLSRLGEREQGVWRATFHHDVRFECRQPAGRIERPAKHIAGIERQQRMLRKLSDLDLAASSQPKRWMTGG